MDANVFMEDFFREALALCINDIRNGGSERSPLSLSSLPLHQAGYNHVQAAFAVSNGHIIWHHSSSRIPASSIGTTVLSTDKQQTIHLP
jgi:hypothetical protein